MGRLEEIRELYAYTRWADARMLRAAAELGSEQFTRDMGSSFGSIRDTLVHILAIHWVWLSRWEGVSPREMPREWKEITLVELRLAWQEVEARQASYLAALSESDLDRVHRFTNTAGQPFAMAMIRMLPHVVNHATYHRGQLATMFRQLGVQPPATDLFLYYLEESSSPKLES